MSSLSDKIRGLKEDKDLIEVIKRDCTFNEIREIIKGWIALKKSFGDDIDMEIVEKYRSSVKLAEASSLATYLQTAPVIKKTSELDIMSFVTDKTTAITIGEEKVIYHNGDKQKEIDSTGGVLGGPNGPQAIAQVMSVCSRYVAAGKDHNKKYTFHADNKFAPRDGLIAAMSALTEMKGVSPSELDRQAQKLSDIDDEEYIVPMTYYNDNCPTINVAGKEEKLVELLQTEEHTEEGKTTSRDIKGRKPIAVRYAIKGEYTPMAKQITVFQMGSKFPAIKRIGRKAWTGTPVDNLPCDHVVALHDAGVKVDSKILVVSADTNLLTTLRSNFGSNVLGVGTGCPQQIPESEVHLWTFDYVYYPNPIVMNATSVFSKACEEVLAKMLKIFKVHAGGKVICHLSPLVLYCKEFCEALGIGYNKSDQVFQLSMVKDESNVEPQHYRPTMATNYPIVKNEANDLYRDEIAYATHIKQFPTLYHRLKGIRTFTQLPWGAIEGVEVNSAITGLSRYGTMMFGTVTKLRPDQVFGHMIGFLRDIYKSIWFMGHTSPHRYEVRLFVPGAVVENLVFCDEYSALYTKSLKDKFEEEDKKEVKGIQEGVMAQAPQSKSDEVRVIKKTKVDVSFDDE